VRHNDGDHAVLAVNVNRLHVFDRQGGQSLIRDQAAA